MKKKKEDESKEEMEADKEKMLVRITREMKKRNYKKK